MKLAALRVGAVLGVLLSWCTLASAAPGDATRLEYARSDRAANCPDQSALKAAVVKRLGYDPFFPAARQTIVVEITDVDAGLRAQMHLIDENGIIRGSRELSERAEHCDELVASLALAISIALDPSAAMGIAPEPAPATAEPKPAERAAEPVDPWRNQPDSEPEPSAPAPVPSKKHRAPPPKKQPSKAGTEVPVGLRGTLFGVVGAAPKAALGWRVGPSMQWAWFKLSAEFIEQFSASSSAQPFGGSAKVSLLEGKLAPCFAFARTSFVACGLLGIGALRSEGQGVENPAKQSNWNVTLGGRFEYTPRLVGPLHLLLNADLNRSLTPITLRLHDETVWKTPILSAALGAGAELLFP